MVLLPPKPPTTGMVGPTSAAVTVTAAVLPFDAHNHVQLGPTPIVFDETVIVASAVAPGGPHDDLVRCVDDDETVTVTPNDDDSHNMSTIATKTPSSYSATTTTEDGTSSTKPICLHECLSGMAVMGTHPKDFPRILRMRHDAEQQRQQQQQSSSTTTTSFQVVACLGVHPWFLHELHDNDWEFVEPQDPALLIPSLDDVENTSDCQCEPKPSSYGVPRWVAELERELITHPYCPVGEIGLDGFHFDPTTKELTTSMDRQIDSFRYQLQMATVYQRPVSVHCVRATGKIMDVLNEIYTHNNKKNKNNKKKTGNRHDHNRPPLPPRIYFHAFGGKAATATQLIQTLERKGKGKTTSKRDTALALSTKCYFGFAPIINFESHKTVDVIKAVGLDRLVLETDHEDAARVESSMKMGIQLIADALSVSEQELILATNANAKDLYLLDDISLPTYAHQTPESKID